MKKIIIIFLLLITSTVSAHMLVGNYYSGTCTLYDYFTTGEDAYVAFGKYVNLERQGIIITPDSNITTCYFQLYYTADDGDIGVRDFYIQVDALDGTALDSPKTGELWRSPEVDGSDLTVNNYFGVLGTNLNLTGGTSYGVHVYSVADGGDADTATYDEDNCMKLGHDEANGAIDTELGLIAITGRRMWRDDGTLEASDTDNLLIRVYAIQ